MAAKPKIGAIIQARMGSTRLPGKVMKGLLGKTVLERVIERVRMAKMVDDVIIATTSDKKDDAIVSLCKELKTSCFRGSEEDVLSRYYEAAKQYKLKVIVRITSDCPLIDPVVTDSVISFYLNNQPVDYVSNTIERTFPRGLDTEVFSMKSLETAHKEAKRPYQREHVTPYIIENMNKKGVKNKEDLSRYRLTLDTPEDFELIDKIFGFLGKNNAMFYLADIIKLLRSHPELEKINAHIKQKELQK